VAESILRSTLSLEVGKPVIVVVKASDVILAVE
jgi:molybdopterin-binding protein